MTDDSERNIPVPSKNQNLTLRSVGERQIELRRDEVGYVLVSIVGEEEHEFILGANELEKLRAWLSPSPSETRAQVWPTYDSAIGEAGVAYLKSVSLDGRYHLSGTFRWYELWDAMNRAASSPLKA